MKKNIEITLDTNIARKMLGVVGFDMTNSTDDEVFEKVLSLINKYGAVSKIINSNIKETINNDAYSNSCDCPECGEHISRGKEERTFFCFKCGVHLHQRAFTKEEIDEAVFEHEIDSYED